MHHRFQRASLAPDGFAVDSVKYGRERLYRFAISLCHGSLSCLRTDRADAFKVDICADPQTYRSVNVPELVVARTTIGDFQSMIRSKTAVKLDGWLEAAKNSSVGSFAGGVEKDIAAVRNAITSPWSNGQTEGQITRLKLIKRQMYGRAKLDLLQARLIGAT